MRTTTFILSLAMFGQTMTALAAAPTAANSTANVNSYSTSTLYVQSGSSRGPVRYILVAPPAHGTVALPAGPVRPGIAKVVYTSARDYVGPDSFSWKANDGQADSNVATCSIVVRAAVPATYPRVSACAFEDQSVDIPAAFRGGGGYSYAAKFADPAHGQVTLDGTTFRYTPAKGYCGTDSFTWRMTYSPKGGGPTASTESGNCYIAIKKAGMNDWPQWRGDELRSGFTTMSLPADLGLQWRRDLPQSVSPYATRGANIYPDIDYCRPVQLGKTLFTPISASDCLAALDTATGNLRWRFYASGPIRRPPAAVALPDGSAAVVFGSDDGWVYCLNATDGTIRWKFRAAPNSRLAVGFGRLCSAWPIWASPVICDGKVYVAAGFIPSFGLYAYRLDAATGRVEWTNDGRISDMWNTSAFGPLAVSYDHARLYGSVEGACRPWAVDLASGEYLGHLNVGFGYPGGGRRDIDPNPTRDGSCGWFTDGMGSYNVPEPMMITVGRQTFDREAAAKLGVTGTVASMLAGDGRLFITTAEGGVYCFGGGAGKPIVHQPTPATLPDVKDRWTDGAGQMLSRTDLKQGLALVLGLGRGDDSGRLVEELARQSSLAVVAVDPDHGRLEKLRAKMEAGGIPAARVATLEGEPMNFGFAPCQAAIIASEDATVAGISNDNFARNVSRWTRPFGGEVWLTTTDEQHAALLKQLSPEITPLCKAERSGGFTRIVRTGVPPSDLRPKPPFGLVAFGCVVDEAGYRPPLRDRDPFTWLPLNAIGPGRAEPPANWKTVGYPDPASISTDASVFTSMVNPLFGLREKFPGLPASGNDGACNGGANHQFGDYGLTAGKLSSIFDTSAGYWGRFFVPEIGGCPGRVFMSDGVVAMATSRVPGSVCGCSPALQFTDIALMPITDEENWVSYQVVRTSNPVEELPIRRIGVNFAAMGDRFVGEDGILWTHHPFSGRYGRLSYNPQATPCPLPLVPVSYAGAATSMYHHSAQMSAGPTGRHRGWVAASYVKGMTGISIPLMQPAVAVRSASAPKLDGRLDDACWGGGHRLTIVPNAVAMNPDRAGGVPTPADHCYAVLRYDDDNLYVAAGAHAEFGRSARRFITVTLNSRERVTPDVVLTCGDTGKRNADRESTGIAVDAWSAAFTQDGPDPFVAEMAIPWKSLADAGLWKEQLIINVSVSGSLLAGRYTPLYLDAVRGPAAGTRSYTVRLYFAEMEGAQPGERVFDVSLQGKPALTGLDVVKQAGGPKRELVREFKDVQICDRLDIGFAPRVGQPMLSGAEIVGDYSPADQPKNALPIAAIEASAVSGPAPLEVILDARKSAAPDGQIVQCAWDTGDGRLARGCVLRHVFAEAGVYKVHLLVRDNRGAMALASTTITVTAGVPAAFVCNIRGDGGDYASLSAWESAIRSDLTCKAGGRSLLFAVKDRGTYAPAADDGKAVKFTGGGTGSLRHINGSNIAYVTGCAGDIQSGPVACDSRHAFTVGDAGNPIYTAVAACYNDWPAGLHDTVTTAPDGPRWETDAIHCVTIRPASGQGHRGKTGDGQGRYTGFALDGSLDLRDIPFTRVEGIIIGPAARFVTGKGASINRVLCGSMAPLEDTMVANSACAALAAANSANTANRHISVPAMSWRDGSNKPPAPGLASIVSSRIGIYNCTAKTFDPGGQAGVEFINCLAVSGGKGFRDARYSEPAYASHCISADGTATTWDSGDGSEANVANQAVDLVDPAGGGCHLPPSDTGARGRGAPALGADIDGQDRPGPRYDVGADAVGG